MPRKEVPSAGPIEAMTVYALAALAELIEQKEPKPARPKNSKKTADNRLARALFILIALGGVGGTTGLILKQAIDDKSSPAATLATDQLVRLDKSIGRFIAINNVIFYQPSNKVGLNINKQAFRDWFDSLNSQPLLKPLVLLFSDYTQRGVDGAYNVVYPLQSNWESKVSGSSQQELFDNFSISISSFVAAMTKYTAMHGFDELTLALSNDQSPQSIEVNKILNEYIRLFKEGKLQPFVVVTAVDADMVERKLGISILH